MFTICTRCQFRMPVRSRLCHICGNERTISLVEDDADSDLDTNLDFHSIRIHISDVLLKDLPALSHRLASKICSQVASAQKKCHSFVGKMCASLAARSPKQKQPGAVLLPAKDNPCKPSGNPSKIALAAPAAVPRPHSERTQPRTYRIVKPSQDSQICPAIVEPELPKARYKQAFEAAAARQKLEELQGWFEDYGRNGIIKNHSATQNDISKSA